MSNPVEFARLRDMLSESCPPEYTVLACVVDRDDAGRFIERHKSVVRVGRFPRGVRSGGFATIPAGSVCRVRTDEPLTTETTDEAGATVTVPVDPASVRWHIESVA